MLVFFIAVFTIAILAASDHSKEKTAEVQKTETESIYLAAESEGMPPRREPEPIPKWMFFLIPTFALLQCIPVVLAASQARKPRLSSKGVAQVNFLCETPMYLGLLGSLLGVCLTQFMTGSVAAPMAYLTTISGIVIYLFAKIAVAIPLGDGSGDIEIQSSNKYSEPQF
jgi:hypothetical protein